jgi:hypothetical protein
VAFGEDFLERESFPIDSSAAVGGADALVIFRKIKEKYPVFD